MLKNAKIKMSTRTYTRLGFNVILFLITLHGWNLPSPNEKGIENLKTCQLADATE